MCERYDRILKIDKGGEKMREVYLPRLWTDKPVKLKGGTQTKFNKKGEGDGGKRGGQRNEEGQTKNGGDQ